MPTREQLYQQPSLPLNTWSNVEYFLTKSFFNQPSLCLYQHTEQAACDSDQRVLHDVQHLADKFSDRKIMSAASPCRRGNAEAILDAQPGEVSMLEPELQPAFGTRRTSKSSGRLAKPTPKSGAALISAAFANFKVRHVNTVSQGELAWWSVSWSGRKPVRSVFCLSRSVSLSLSDLNLPSFQLPVLRVPGGTSL